MKHAAARLILAHTSIIGEYNAATGPKRDIKLLLELERAFFGQITFFYVFRVLECKICILFASGTQQPGHFFVIGILRI